MQPLCNELLAASHWWCHRALIPSRTLPVFKESTLVQCCRLPCRLIRLLCECHKLLYILPLSLCGQTKLPAGVSSLFIVTTQYWYTYWHLKPFKALECWYLSVVECTWICGCARTFVCTPLENTSLPIMKFHWYHRQHRVIELRGDLSTFVCVWCRMNVRMTGSLLCSQASDGVFDKAAYICILNCLFFT